MAWQIEFEVFPYQGKDDLLSNLPARLRGYSRFLPDTWRLVVLIERDNNDCIVLKKRLEAIAAGAGLITRSSSKSGRYALANRVVIEEVEAWYFGDWHAVRQAFPRIDKSWPDKAGYRGPDSIAGGIWEAFERIAKEAGYFKGGLRKVEAAKRIGSHLSPATNRSRSFQALRTVIEELIGEP